MDKEALMPAEVERLRALLELSPELVEMAEFRRAEKASLEATSRLTRGSEQVTRTLVFRTPAVQEGGMFGALRGLTILKTDGKWSAVSAVTTTELETAERSYLGGRLNTITEGEAIELIEAGYTPETRTTEGRGTSYAAWEPEQDPTKEESNAVHQ